MISSARRTTQGGSRLLERAHRFLTARGRAEIEAVADRFFRALGYRRRADFGRALIFDRGRPGASYYAASLRSCATRVEVDFETGGETGAALVRHQVETRGRLILAEDVKLLDTEARAFESFLEQQDLDTAALMEATARAGHNGALIKLAAVIGLLGAITAAIVAMAVIRGS